MPNEIATPEASNGAALPAEGQTPEQGTPVTPPSTGTPAAAPSGDSQPGTGRNRELAIERDAALEYGEFWRKRFEESQQRPAPVAPQPEEDPRPKRADFDDDDAWADALSTWTENRATKKAEAAADARFAKVREEDRLRTQQSTFATRAESFAKGHPDFQTTISNPALTFLNGEFLGVIMESEKGPELAYHIGKSPELVAKLTRMTVPQRLAALGRIEADLSRPPPAPKPSGAPPPPTPISSGASGGGVDLEKLSAKEYLRVRLEQRAAKGKR